MEGGSRTQGIETVSRRWKSRKQPSVFWVRSGECSKAAVRNMRSFKNCRTVGGVGRNRSEEKQGRIEGQQQ